MCLPLFLLEKRLSTCNQPVKRPNNRWESTNTSRQVDHTTSKRAVRRTNERRSHASQIEIIHDFKFKQYALFWFWNTTKSTTTINQSTTKVSIANNNAKIALYIGKTQVSVSKIMRIPSVNVLASLAKRNPIRQHESLTKLKSKCLYVWKLICTIIKVLGKYQLLAKKILTYGKGRIIYNRYVHLVTVKVLIFLMGNCNKMLI